jgi:hypothetical protein
MACIQAGGQEDAQASHLPTEGSTCKSGSSRARGQRTASPSGGLTRFGRTLLVGTP